jgi:GT2 family glycosyltransferase
VVIPAYNAEATIKAAVGSALLQTAESLEVVVVDDGSTDTTAETLAGLGDPRVRVIHQSNRGLPAARNAGIAASRGRYVAFLDSDDLLLPDFLTLGGRALRAKSKPGFAYTDAFVLDSTTGRVRVSSAMWNFGPPTPPPERPDEFLALLLAVNFVYVSTIVPRLVFEAVGVFDETRTSCEDYDLWLRIVAAGFEPAWFPDRHAVYRLHPGQMTRNVMRMASNLAAVYDDLPSEAMPTPDLRDLLLERRRQAHRSLRWIAPLRARLPQSALIAARSRRNSWYATPPRQVADLISALR